METLKKTKLKAEYLSPYLNSGVECSYTEWPDGRTRHNAILTHVGIDGLGTTFKRRKRSGGGSLYNGDDINYEGNNNTGSLDFKLHLRPLSDIVEWIKCEKNKEYLVEMDGNFAPINDLSVMSQSNYSQEEQVDIYENLVDIAHGNYDPLKAPYWIIDKLLEWHFDIFGLIEKGWAKKIR